MHKSILFRKGQIAQRKPSLLTKGNCKRMTAPGVSQPAEGLLLLPPRSSLPLFLMLWVRVLVTVASCIVALYNSY
jgi:hypothetical protein